MERLLVTSALPYANGPIHLGHLVEYIQTDIYVRFLRSCGADAIYLCADDTHGTPIEVNAAKQGLSPEQFIGRWSDEHQRDFADFEIRFDAYGSTNSPENRKYAELCYERLKAAGDIVRREIEQTYCETDKRFLPDRFVRGTCPNCKAPDQYGDVCERCGKTYVPTDLIEPRCVICGNPPVRRTSTHLFFQLSRHADFLLELIRGPHFLNQGVARQLEQFFQKGLADWDITRDGPYFGFPIPGETDKYFYVWLDAPIGYIATTELWAKQTGKAPDALALWGAAAEGTRILHVIGKDIVYFHALFWPAVLYVSGLKLPERIIVHGHLTINGEKMSKSRGTLISARAYLDRLDPAYLRFFYASNLGAGPEDIDLSLAEFRHRVNAELVNNIGNLANRTLSMLASALDGRLAPAGEGPGKALVEAALERAREVRTAFERFEYRTAIKTICDIAQTANAFLQNQAPWSSIKRDPEIARRDLSDAAEVAYLVAGLLAPVVPKLAQKLFEQLGAPALTYARLATARYPLLERGRIGTPAPIIGRLEQAQVDGLIVTSAAPAAPAAGAPPGAGAARPAAAAARPPEAKPRAAETPDTIEYDDFAKVALRVGVILTAERVPKADKLLKLTVDVGEGTPRTIAAGIAEAYAPEALVGRRVVVVTNLKPRALRGIESRGMLLAAGPGGKDVSLVDPGPMPPGAEVK